MKKIGIKVLISITLLIIVMHNADLGIAANRLFSANLSTIATAVVLIVGLLALQTVRWTTIVAATGCRLRFATALRLVLISYFFSQTLPSSLGGDAVRIWYARSAGLSTIKSFVTVILDRLVAMFALLLVIASTLPWLFDLADTPVVPWTLAGLSSVGLLGLFSILALDRIPAQFLRKVPHVIQQLSEDARTLFFGVRYSLLSVVLSLLVHIAITAVVFMLAQALDVRVTLWNCMLLVPPTILAMTLPVSIAGWGVREGAMVSALGWVSVPPSDALALSVLFGAVLLLAGLPGALLWLLHGRATGFPQPGTHTNIGS